MGKRSRKYREASQNYDAAAVYPLEEGIDLVKKMTYAKFDETIEIAVKLNLKKSQSVRDTMVLPNQFQREKRILVFAKGEKATEAKEAGAVYVGDQDLVEKIKGGWLDFDIAVATPDMMKNVGKLGQILGRRGLMPNPKTHTVTFNIKEAITELQKGRTEFRSDKTGVIHLAIGKASMSADKIKENARVFIEEVSRKRPVDIKGDFMKSVSLSATMGPGVKIAV